MAEVGAPTGLDRVESILIVSAFACVIFILLQKIQKMANKDTTFGYQPVDAHMPMQTGGGETQPEDSKTLCPYGTELR